MYHYLTSDDLTTTDWNPPVSWFVSRVFWREVGSRLKNNPEVVEQSKDYVDLVLKSGEFSCSRIYLEQWKKILDEGLENVVSVLCSVDDDRSQVLRSCSPLPLLKVLSEQEREALREGVRKEVLRFREALLTSKG